jgi:hypothetical protein
MIRIKCQTTKALIGLIFLMGSAEGLAENKPQPSPATPAAAAPAEQIPICPRPADMSVTKAVAEYHSCLDKKKKACRTKEKHPECVKLKVASEPPPRFPENPEDINPAERCSIFKDGSYKCVQNPVRFIAKEKPPVFVPPASSPAPGIPTSPGGAPAPGTEGAPAPQPPADGNPSGQTPTAQ